MSAASSDHESYAGPSTSGESSTSGASHVPPANKRASSQASSSAVGSSSSTHAGGSSEPGKVPKWFKAGTFHFVQYFCIYCDEKITELNCFF